MDIPVSITLEDTSGATTTLRLEPRPAGTDEAHAAAHAAAPTAAPTGCIVMPARVFCESGSVTESGRFEVELVFGDQSFAPDVGYDLALWLVRGFAARHQSDPFSANCNAVWHVKRGAVAIIVHLRVTGMLHAFDVRYRVTNVVQLLRGARYPVALPLPTHVVVSALTSAEHDAKVAAAAALAEPDIAALAPGGWVQRPLKPHGCCGTYHLSKQRSSAFVLRLVSFKPLSAGVSDAAATWIHAAFTRYMCSRDRFSRFYGVWKCAVVPCPSSPRLVSVLARFVAAPAVADVTRDGKHPHLITSSFFHFCTSDLAQALQEFEFPAVLYQVLYTGISAVDDAYLDRLWP